VAGVSAGRDGAGTRHLFLTRLYEKGEISRSLDSTVLSGVIATFFKPSPVISRAFSIASLIECATEETELSALIVYVTGVNDTV
jgi:hypothetical protein